MVMVVVNARPHDSCHWLVPLAIGDGCSHASADPCVPLQAIQGPGQASDSFKLPCPSQTSQIGLVRCVLFCGIGNGEPEFAVDDAHVEPAITYEQCQRQQQQHQQPQQRDCITWP